MQGAGERLLLLEPIGGLAGDMCLAALLDLGDRLGLGESLRAALGAGFRALADAVLADGGAAAPASAAELGAIWLRESRVEVNGIRALHVEVELAPALAARETHHRAWREIRRWLTAAKLPEGARERALSAYGALARAEGQIHGVPPEEIELHEVGAIDAIADVLGASLLLDLLARERGASEVLTLPLPAGSGVTRSAHGPIPLPAPATLELLRGHAMRPSGPGERTTPTGAALATSLTKIVNYFPANIPQATGYGAGSKRWDDAPNLLRASLAEPAATARGEAVETLWQLEANLDDCSPQLLAAAAEALLAAGAKDAWIAPVVMKKGRPGHLLCALVDQARREECEAIYFRETTTLGVRAFHVERRALEREFVEVQTRFGAVRVKLGRRGEAVVQATPEYEDCLTLARAQGVAVREVQAEAMAAWRERARR